MYHPKETRQNRKPLMATIQNRKQAEVIPNCNDIYPPEDKIMRVDTDSIASMLRSDKSDA